MLLKMTAFVPSEYRCRPQMRRAPPVSVLAPRAVTTISNSSLTEPPRPSLAVTFTGWLPTCAAPTLATKVPVAAVNVSHEGSGVSSPFVAA